MADSGSALIPPLTSVGGFGSGTQRSLATPWLDYASLSVPDNHELILWWAQYLWITDGNYRTAMERVASHFMTAIDFPDLSASEESVWKEFFSNQFNYRRELPTALHDFLAYGNLFLSLYLPFKRFLQCSKCALEQPISELEYNLEFKPTAPYVSWGRTRKCPKCESGDPYVLKDRRDPDLSKVRLVRYESREIELAMNRFSGRKDIYWKPTDEDRRDITGKARIHIDDTPLEVLEAVAVNGKLRFNPDLILHESESIISGVRTRGWGMPRCISNFRTAWMQQVTNKADQAVSIDYTLGMRFISPAPTNGGADDPMQTHGMEEFVSKMNRIVQEQRNNPASIFTVPYPINYQFAGGEGWQLLPPDKLKFRQQEYLNQLGVPLEYHQMNLTTQAAPMALRLFESYWQSIPHTYNRILNWVVDALTRVYGLEATRVEMQKTTIADDMERKQAMLQLMAANQLSPQTALKPFGIDAHMEVDRVIRHQEYVAKKQQEAADDQAKQQEMGILKGLTAQPSPSVIAQQQMQAAQGGGGGAPPGGAPPGAPMGGMPMGGMPGAGGQNPQTLQQMSEQATQIAQQLVSMPEYNRKQQLKAIREGNKELHALVTSNLEKIRSQARSQGGQQMLQQGAPPPPM